MTHDVVPCTAAGREEDEGADERGPGVGEREGKGRAQARLGRCWATTAAAPVGPTHAGREEDGGGVEWAVAGQNGRGGGNETVGLYPFLFHFFFFLAYVCTYLNDFEFKFECMSMQKCTTISSTSLANIHTPSVTPKVLFSYFNLFVKITYVGYICYLLCKVLKSSNL